MRNKENKFSKELLSFRKVIKFVKLVYSNSLSRKMGLNRKVHILHKKCQINC